MTATVYRILGPTHNRLLTVIEDPDHKLGQVDHVTAEQLLQRGWTRYQGPAKAPGGWADRSTDPNLRPRRVQIPS